MMDHEMHEMHESGPEDRFGFLNTEHTEYTEGDSTDRSGSSPRSVSVYSVCSVFKNPSEGRGIGQGPIGPVYAFRSKRSRFITLSHAATKSRTNDGCESSHA